MLPMGISYVPARGMVSNPPVDSLTRVDSSFVCCSATYLQNSLKGGGSVSDI